MTVTEVEPPADSSALTTLSAEDLLLGSKARHVVTVPADLLGDGIGDAPRTVTIRPLVLADVQRIHRAAGEGTALTSVLMVQQALVEPSLTVDQANRLSAGLVQFLVGEVNRVSGLALTGDEIADAVQAPMARACFVLSHQFGWTPEECAALTVGQILLYLEMLGKGETWPTSV